MGQAPQKHIGRRRRSGRRSPPTRSCRSPSSRTPASSTGASATRRRQAARASSSRAQRPCSRSRRASGESRFGSASSAPTRRRDRRRPSGDRQGQLPARQRPGSLANEPADLRRDRLPRPLAGRRPPPPRREREAEVRVPARTGGEVLPDPARLPRPASGSRSARGGELRIETALGRPSRHSPVSYQRSEAGGSPSRASSCSGAAAPTASPSELRPPLPARHRPRPWSTPPSWAEAALTTATESRSMAPAAPT